MMKLSDYNYNDYAYSYSENLSYSNTSNASNSIDTREVAFSTHLLNELISKDENNSLKTENETSNEITEQVIMDFLNGSNGKFTATIDWSVYKDKLSDTQIAGLSRQYGGELTITQYAQAMKAIAKLEQMKLDEDEVLAEMSEKTITQQEETAQTNQDNQSNELMESLNFLTINQDTIFADANPDIFQEFALKLYNQNNDISNFYSLLGEDEFEKSKYGEFSINTENPLENTKVESDSVNSNSAPLGLNSMGQYAHLTPILVQNIKEEIEKI